MGAVPVPILTPLPRLSATRATVVALLATISEAFDVPVFWPILVVYFCVLFALTMRRQIQYVLHLLEWPKSVRRADSQRFDVDI